MRKDKMTERKVWGKAEFVPAIGEQLNSVYNRGLNFKGFDLKFFTEQSHFQHNIALQSCWYGFEGVGKCVDGETNKNPLACKTFKKDGYRDLIGFPKDKTLVTDSGGFQVASWKKKGIPCPIKPIDSLRWQEANADIGMNLDIPSTLSEVPTYEDFMAALNESVENFALFEKERKNYDMWMYNVLHGENLKFMDIWYNKVKDFKFDGFAVGMKPPSNPMIQAMGFMYLWEKGEFDKESCKGVHFFGTSGKHVVPVIAYIAHKFPHLRITYDSSSYNIGSIYRTYYTPLDIGTSLSFGDKFQTENPHITELPCKCPVCQSITDINILNGKDIFAGTLISLHNMWQYIYYNDILNSLVRQPNKFLEFLSGMKIKNKTLQSIKFVDFVIEHGMEKAVKVFEKDLIPQHVEKTKQAGIFEF